MEFEFFSACPTLQPHISFYSNCLLRVIFQVFLAKLSVFKFFKAYPSQKPLILVNIIGLPICYGFPDITHIIVNNGRKTVILNFIQKTFFRACPFMKPHILFYF